MSPSLLRVASAFVALVSYAFAQNAPSPAMSTGLPQGYGAIQAQLRAEIDPASFVTSFMAPGQQAMTNSNYGSVRFLLGQNSPALSTLPNGGLAQGVIRLAACGLWSPHHHARANEILYIASGNLSIGFQEENASNTSSGMVGGRLLNFTVPAGSSIVIPQGLMHYAFNPSCQPAEIVTSFDNKDPGTISEAQQFFSLPTSIVAAATGLSEAAISIVRNQVSQTAIISVDRTCLMQCPNSPAASMASSPMPAAG